MQTDGRPSPDTVHARGLADLKLDELKVVYPGTTRCPLDERVEVLPLGEVV